MQIFVKMPQNDLKNRKIYRYFAPETYDLNVGFQLLILIGIIMFGLEKVSWTTCLIFLSVALIVFNVAVFLYFKFFKKDSADLKKSKVQKFSV